MQNKVIDKVDISIHALHAECDLQLRRYPLFNIRISIHALHTECDLAAKRPISYLSEFQSTHSMRSATKSGKSQAERDAISFHALHTECDYRRDGVNDGYF